MSTDFAAVISPQATGLSSTLREPSPTPAPPVKQQLPPPDAEEPPAESQGTRSLNQAIQFPDHVAMLRVHMVAMDEFRLEGSNTVVGDLPYRKSKQYRRPKLALGVIADKGGKEPRIIFQSMPEWSKHFVELCGWLNALRVEFGEDLHLLIDDGTGMEIPWNSFTFRKALRLAGRPVGSVR